MDTWSNSQGTGFPIQGYWVQNHWMASRLTKVFIILRSIKCIPEFVVNSNLYLHSGSVAMRQLNPMHEKGPWNLKFFESIDRISAFKLFNIDESYTECGN